MKRMACIRFLSMLTILFYSTALAQTSQIITQSEMSWAKNAVQQEKTMGAISTPNSVAVLSFNNKSGEDKLNPLQKGMAVMLISDLAKLEQLQVVSRVRMQALLDEMGLGSPGTTDPESIPRVAKLLGAYFIVSGDIMMGSRQNIQINSSVLDVPFEALSHQPAVSEKLDQLSRLEKKVLFNLVEQLQVTLSPAKKVELQAPLSTSTTALLALFLGIDHSDKGQYSQAMRMYKQALIEDPDLKMAKTGIQELEALGENSAEEVVLSGDEPLSPPPVDAEDSSMTTYLGIGLAVVAVGGLALAMSGSGGSDSDTPAPVDPPPVDTTPPTVIPSPDVATTVKCSEGLVTFTFSKSMSVATGEITISPQGFAGGSWSDAQHYVVSWDHAGNNYCTGFNSDLVVVFSGVEDSSGNALSGRSRFAYNVSEN